MKDYQNMCFRREYRHFTYSHKPIFPIKSCVKAAFDLGIVLQPKYINMG